VNIHSQHNRVCLTHALKARIFMGLLASVLLGCASVPTVFRHVPKDSSLSRQQVYASSQLVAQCICERPSLRVFDRDYFVRECYDRPGSRSLRSTECYHMVDNTTPPPMSLTFVLSENRAVRQRLSVEMCLEHQGRELTSLAIDAYDSRVVIGYRRTLMMHSGRRYWWKQVSQPTRELQLLEAHVRECAERLAESSQ